MKVEVNETEIKFPCLMVSETGQIVLMVKPKSGFVIKSRVNTIGYYSCNWDMSCLAPLNESITLSND